MPVKSKVYSMNVSPLKTNTLIEYIYCIYIYLLKRNAVLNKSIRIKAHFFSI